MLDAGCGGPVLRTPVRPCRRMKSLVTGGAGFLGSHVARRCLGLGHDVVVLDDLSGGFEDQVPKGAEFVEGSITDAALLEFLFRRQQFDYVYHLAAYAAEGLSHFIRRFNYQNNVVGSANLINESVKHGVKRFVFTSSIAVYSGTPPFDESMTPSPKDPYGVAKYAVELDLAAAHDMFGLEYTVFRPHNVYGPNQALGDPYRNVVGIFMRQAMANEPMTVFGDGQQVRAFSYVDDVAPYIAGCVDVPHTTGRTYDLGGLVPFTVMELADVVSKIFDRPLTVRHLPPRNEIAAAWGKHRRFHEDFWPRSIPVSLFDGLGRMAAWARTAGVHPTRRPVIEVRKNLPESWR